MKKKRKKKQKKKDGSNEKKTDESISGIDKKPNLSPTFAKRMNKKHVPKRPLPPAKQSSNETNDNFSTSHTIINTKSNNENSDEMKTNTNTNAKNININTVVGRAGRGVSTASKTSRTSRMSTASKKLSQKTVNEFASKPLPAPSSKGKNNTAKTTTTTATINTQEEISKNNTSNKSSIFVKHGGNNSASSNSNSFHYSISPSGQITINNDRICAQCNKIIEMTEDCIVDNNCYLHFTCFVCDKCGKQLEGLMYGKYRNGTESYNRLCKDCCTNSYRIETINDTSVTAAPTKA